MSRNLFEYHPVIGYRFIPGIRARVRHEGGGYLVRCNQMGFRCDHEVTLRRPPGIFRILLFGDSYTAGEGVGNAHRFGDLLEDRIPSVQVLNFALPGSGTDQQFLTFREFATDLDYDLLLICPMVENIRRNVQTHRLTRSAFNGTLVLRAKPYFQLDNTRLLLRHSPVPKGPVDDQAPVTSSGSVHRLIRKLTSQVDKRIPGFRRFTQRLRRLALPAEYNDPRHPAWMLMRAILTQWVRESKAAAVVCPLPTFSHIDGSMRPGPYLRRFSELARDLDIELVDILPQFLAERLEARRRLRFAMDEHPTPHWHTFVADALVAHVKRHISSRHITR